MPGEGAMSYFGSLVENLVPARGDDAQTSKSGSVIGFLTKTALFGGIVATSYYLGKDSTKPNGVVSKILGRPKLRVNKAKEFEGCILHCYDHCPFSIRVELALAFLGVPYTRVLYGYGDVEGPKKLLGKKQLPVMEYMKVLTPESLDIINMLDSNTRHRSIPGKTTRVDLVEWREDSKKIRQDLCRPRKIKMPVKDWADVRDTRYARQKHENKRFNYRDAVVRTSELIDKMNRLLEKFNDKMLYDEHSVNEFGFGMDDILVIPDLRTLTCVKGLKWPAKLRKYLENAFEDVEAELYFKHAVE